MQTLENLQAALSWNPFAVTGLAAQGAWPIIRPADDTSDPKQAADPMIERFMRAMSRLDPVFYGGRLAQWIELCLPPVMTPLDAVDRELRKLGFRGLPLPRVYASSGTEIS